MSISQRIIKYMELKNLKAVSISNKTGLSEGRISNILKGKNEPGGKALSTILNSYPEINARWLLTGEGEMLNKNSQIVNEETIKYGICEECCRKDKIIDHQAEYIDQLKKFLKECTEKLEKRKAS